MRSEVLNRIEFIVNRKERPEIPIRLEGYAIFSNNWICELHNCLINERTGEKHYIQEVDCWTNSEWDNSKHISKGYGFFREVKRSAIKTEIPLNPDDFYIATTT